MQLAQSCHGHFMAQLVKRSSFELGSNLWACSTKQESVSTLFLVLVLAIYVVVVSYLVNGVTSFAAVDSFKESAA